MIATPQLCVLRTLTSPSPFNLRIRTSQGLALNSQHVSRWLPSSVPPRFLSTTSPRSSIEASSSKTPTTTTTTHKTHPTPSKSTISPTAANPPATTRPAPLNLPEREPNSSTFSFYFATGKAYVTFYKTGLKNIYLNTRLVWSLDAAARVPSAAETPPPGDIATPPTTTRAVGSTTRSTLLLRRRWRHDVRRLPLFALLLLLCGEFTPLVVMAMPKLVPYTCRIPRQVETLQRKAEARRAASFQKREKLALLDADEGGASLSSSSRATASLSGVQTVAHIARSLNLISPLWDRLGISDETLAALPSTQLKVRRHLDFLKKDDALLVQAGGVAALEDEEVVLACEDRAIDTIGESNEELRKKLRSWLQYITNQMDPTA